jgi:hypothetical protein
MAQELIMQIPCSEQFKWQFLVSGQRLKLQFFNSYRFSLYFFKV